jgi:osomolarity two-component system response regulator SSK1
VRQVLLVAQPGDTIELGLQVVPQSPSLTPRVSLPLTVDDVDAHRRRGGGSGTRSSSPGRTLPSPPAGHTNGPLLCIFEVVHNINQLPGSAAATPKAELNPFTRLNEQAEAAKPNFDTVLCRRLLTHQNASLKIDAQPSSPLGSGMPRRAYELSVLLPRGQPMVDTLSVEEEAMRQPFPGMKLAKEPTLSELSDFAESLRGKKVTLHASLTSLFARHLTSYLAAWGLDISHIPIEDPLGENLSNFGAPPLALSTGSYRTTSLGEAQAAPKEEGNFVIIDDDVAVLRRELTRIRLESSPVLSFKPRLLKRPTLASRTRSSPQVRSAPVPRPGAPVIIHFTSLAKYNHVRDTVSSLLGGSPMNSPFANPEVIVIPKPVGPRRFLTALHTAANQPVVDPFFSPIATSPRSPGGGYFSARTPGVSELGKDDGFFEGATTNEDTGLLGQRNVSDSSTGSQKARSPLGEFPPSQASVVRTDAGLHLSIPTPGEVMATPAHEYFESAVSRASSGSGSAVIMQSPDGRPVGMFFEPPSRDNRRVSYNRRTSNTRKTQSRRASGGATDVQDQGDSPRNQNQSRMGQQSNEDSTRRTKETPTLSRAASRRRTLPTPAPGTSEPILAMGRDRSATTTSRNSEAQVPSPAKIVGPGSKEPGVVPVTTPKAKASKPATLPVIKDAKSTTPAKKGAAAKKGGQDSVVPPINVLIVEGMSSNSGVR